MSQLSQKRVAVVGLGVSGVAAARLCLLRDARVTAVDALPPSQWSPAAQGLLNTGVRYLEDGNLDGAELIVVSPGVAPGPALLRAQAKGIPMISEVELAYRELRGRAPGVPIIAVGGTNGKSTTTALVHAMAEANGLRAFLGGNFGEPLSAHVDEAWDVVVLEVSSFQMERVVEFKPDVSLLLNVSADHLDRYESLEAYAAAKGNAFARQGPGDLAVIPLEDTNNLCRTQAERGKAVIATFGMGAGADVRVSAEAIVETARNEHYPLADVAIAGRHNALNVAAAIAAVGAKSRFVIEPSKIREALRAFRGLPHRTALVGEFKGIRFYDDSKGTNVGAAVTALLGVDEPKVVLIAGGRDKGGSYEPLVAALRQKARGAVLIGEAADAIDRAIAGAVLVRRATSMRHAVFAATQLAQAGDAVLLSPACSSFDMFRDYKDRGDAFVAAIRRLPEEFFP